MLRIIISLACMLVILITTGCGGGGGSSSDETPVVIVPLSDSVREDLAPIAAGASGIGYPVNIYLPRGYDQATENYPVIYTTDGETHFDNFADILDRLEINVILVAVGNAGGVTNTNPYGYRIIDYSPAGYDVYYDFFITELFPYVESQYRIDNTNRTLVGHSLGGIFVIASLLKDDPIAPKFQNYLSIDGTFGLGPILGRLTTLAELENLATQRFLMSDGLNAEVVLAGSTLEGGNNTTVDQLKTILDDTSFADLFITKVTSPLDHNGIVLPVFEDAIMTWFL